MQSCRSKILCHELQRSASALSVCCPPFTIELRSSPVDSSARNILCITNQLEDTLRGRVGLTSEEAPKESEELAGKPLSFILPEMLSNLCHPDLELFVHELPFRIKLCVTKLRQKCSEISLVLFFELEVGQKVVVESHSQVARVV